MWERWAVEEQRKKDYNQHMADKMAQFDAMDDAKWTASQIAIAQREKEKDKAAYDHRMGEHTGDQDVVDKVKLPY